MFQITHTRCFVWYALPMYSYTHTLYVHMYGASVHASKAHKNDHNNELVTMATHAGHIVLYCVCLSLPSLLSHYYESISEPILCMCIYVVVPHLSIKKMIKITIWLPTYHANIFLNVFLWQWPICTINMLGHIVFFSVLIYLYSHNI